MNLHQILAGPVTAELAANGIRLVLSANTRTTGDAWCDAVDAVRASTTGHKVALIHLHDGSWTGGAPRYRNERGGWENATMLRVSYPIDDDAAARTILEVLRRHGLNATWDGNVTSAVHIHLGADVAEQANFPVTTADRLRRSHQYAETHVSHSHDVMLTAADELDRLTAEVESLKLDLGGEPVESAVAADRNRSLTAARADAERDALRDLHKKLIDEMRSGTTVRDLAQVVDDYFVEKGLGTVIYA